MCRALSLNILRWVWPRKKKFIVCGSGKPEHRDDTMNPYSINRVILNWLGDRKWSCLDQKWTNIAVLSTFRSGPKGSKMPPNGRFHIVFYRTPVRSLGMLVSDSLPNSLTDSVTFSRLDWCDPGVWRCQLKTCWGCYCCWCWWWETFWRQLYADLEAEVWS